MKAAGSIDLKNGGAGRFRDHRAIRQNFDGVVGFKQAVIASGRLWIVDHHRQVSPFLAGRKEGRQP